MMTQKPRKKLQIHTWLWILALVMIGLMVMFLFLNSKDKTDSGIFMISAMDTFMAAILLFVLSKLQKISIGFDRSFKKVHLVFLIIGYSILGIGILMSLVQLFMIEILGMFVMLVGFCTATFTYGARDTWASKLDRSEAISSFAEIISGFGKYDEPEPEIEYCQYCDSAIAPRSRQCDSCGAKIKRKKKA